ncbi:hypothetical protein EMIHUDRAFT_462484, partial [Emiliania huxleyi CCMP1516]
APLIAHHASALARALVWTLASPPPHLPTSRAARQDGRSPLWHAWPARRARAATAAGAAAAAAAAATAGGRRVRGRAGRRTARGGASARGGGAARSRASARASDATRRPRHRVAIGRRHAARRRAGGRAGERRLAVRRRLRCRVVQRRRPRDSEHGCERRRVGPLHAPVLACRRRSGQADGARPGQGDHAVDRRVWVGAHAEDGGRQPQVRRRADGAARPGVGGRGGVCQRRAHLRAQPGGQWPGRAAGVPVGQRALGAGARVDRRGGQRHSGGGGEQPA